MSGGQRGTEKPQRERMRMLLLMSPTNKLGTFLKRPHPLPKSCEMWQVTALNKYHYFNNEIPLIYPLLWLYLFRWPLMNSFSKDRIILEQDPPTRSLSTGTYRSPAWMPSPCVPFQFYHAALLTKTITHTANWSLVGNDLKYDCSLNTGMPRSMDGCFCKWGQDNKRGAAASSPMPCFWKVKTPWINSLMPRPWKEQNLNIYFQCDFKYDKVII